MLAALAPSASASTAPTVVRSISEQATIEADFSTSGLKFNLNAGREREFINGVQTRDELKAVGSVSTCSAKQRKEERVAAVPGSHRAAR
jgi:hypothetical protein